MGSTTVMFTVRNWIQIASKTYLTAAQTVVVFLPTCQELLDRSKMSPEHKNCPVSEVYRLTSVLTNYYW